MPQEAQDQEKPPMPCPVAPCHLILTIKPTHYASESKKQTKHSAPYDKDHKGNGCIGRNHKNNNFKKP